MRPCALHRRAGMLWSGHKTRSPRPVIWPWRAALFFAWSTCNDTDGSTRKNVCRHLRRRRPLFARYSNTGVSLTSRDAEWGGDGWRGGGGGGDGWQTGRVGGVSRQHGCAAVKCPLYLALNALLVSTSIGKQINSSPLCRQCIGSESSGQGGDGEKK